LLEHFMAHMRSPGLQLHFEGFGFGASLPEEAGGLGLGLGALPELDELPLLGGLLLGPGALLPFAAEELGSSGFAESLGRAGKSEGAAGKGAAAAAGGGVGAAATGAGATGASGLFSRVTIAAAATAATTMDAPMM
jgi:hypothetical protein